MDKEKIKSIAQLVFIVGLFLLLSFLIQNNIEFVKQYLDIGFLGMVIFVIIVALSIILAPISSTPLFPLGASLWGWVATGFLGTIGWTIGAVVAFLLARKYGVTFVQKMLPLKTLKKWEKRIPEKHLFWTVLLLRMFIPIDGVSYVIGLFSKMKFKPYFIATVIGLIPSTFFTAYIGSISFVTQVALITLGVLLLGVGLVIAKYLKKIPVVKFKNQENE
ncbi:MAG: VTT domain-containing protein [bacterium]|nr:VTT domain-containing protein [bacterium]